MQTRYNTDIVSSPANNPQNQKEIILFKPHQSVPMCMFPPQVVCILPTISRLFISDHPNLRSITPLPNPWQLRWHRRQVRQCPFPLHPPRLPSDCHDLWYSWICVQWELVSLLLMLVVDSPPPNQNLNYWNAVMMLLRYVLMRY